MSLLGVGTKLLTSLLLPSIEQGAWIRDKRTQLPDSAVYMLLCPDAEDRTPVTSIVIQKRKFQHAYVLRLPPLL